MYAKVLNGQVAIFPYSLTRLGKDYPTISIPKNPTQAQLKSLGIYDVQLSEMPVFDKKTQYLQQINPVLVGDQWTQAWAVETHDAEKIQALDLHERISVRAQRDEKLAKSDWTQLADSSVDKAAWATYRQALRDIPAQEGFPWSVVWPETP